MKKFFIAFIVGLALAFLYFYWRNATNQTFTPPKTTETKPTFSIDLAPKNSIRGKAESMSGQIKWESRTATEPAQITSTPDAIQQGEILETGGDGRILVTFSEIGSVNIGPESAISFAQLLPGNFVFNQSRGDVTYTKNSQTPFGIRILHLLVTMDEGQVKIALDRETGKITIDVKKGAAQLGFNDPENISTLENIKEGEKVIFDDETREVSPVGS